MGLDMYLEKVSKIGDMTLNEILETAEYIEYQNRPTEYKDSSFARWCNGDMNLVREDMIDAVKDNIKVRYYTWDDTQSYGRERIFDSVMYWRKANQIHKWFVENIQDGVDDCGIYVVSEEQLTELYDTAKRVLETKDQSVARKLLPTTSGFFFGSTEYDQWYYENVKETVEQLEKCLKEIDFENEIVYYTSSW